MDSNRQLLPALGDAYDISPRHTRKRKREAERLRVTRACDRCKRRKIKCNGVQPCELCVRAKISCTFASNYARGRDPAAPPEALGNETGDGDVDMLPERIMTPSESTPSVPDRQYSTMQSHDRSQTYSQAQNRVQSENNSLRQPDDLQPSTSTRPTTLSSRQTPEPPQEDLQGHYIGPASGISFLLRVQKRLHKAISFSVPSSIFTFGDAPLRPPDIDPTFCMILPRADAQRLFDRYFDFAMPTYRFLHRPTLQEWFVEFYDTMGTMRDGRDGRGAAARIALLFMIFAHARVYMPEDDRPGPQDLSSRYFLAAEHQLSKESGSIRLTSVQARLLQCYYLLTQSRVNHCWSQFGTVTSLTLTLGLNRNKNPGAASGLNHVEVESRRRTFWCVYTLDTYLSVSLGRPRLLHDDDIDAQLPACVEDEEITRDQIGTAALDRGHSITIMLAPIAHMKLARVIGKALRSLYSIKPMSSGRRAQETQRISRDLSEWRAEHARFLDADFFNTSLIVPIFQRQRNVLNLTYWHAIILTHRQAVLSDFAQISQQGQGQGQGQGGRGAGRAEGPEGTDSRENPQAEESVRQCLAAAVNTMNTIDEITHTKQMFHAFWITAYFAFTAAMVLYIYVIQKWESPPETYGTYFAAATRCQSHMSAIAQQGSLLERYCVVLEELRVEALRHMRRTNPSLAQGDAGALAGGGTGVSQGVSQETAGLGLGMEFRGLAGAVPAPAQVDTSPSDGTNYTELLAEAGHDFNGMFGAGMGDFSGWGQFASMVSSGLGNLDGFIDDDTFRV